VIVLRDLCAQLGVAGLRVSHRHWGRVVLHFSARLRDLAESGGFDTFVRSRLFSVRQTSIFALLGPAVVLYLIAAAAASLGGLDLGGMCVAVTASALSLALPAMRRKGTRGAERVGWLGLCLGLSLIRGVVPPTLLLSLDVAELLGLAGSGALLLDLALTTPDRLVFGARGRVLSGLPYVAAVLVAGVGWLAAGPAVELFGEPILLPSGAALAPQIFLALSAPVALGLRVARGRLGSDPDALASSGWATLVLWPVSAWLLLDAGLTLDGATLGSPVLHRGVGMVAALLLLWGHLRLVDPEQRLRVGPTTRRLVALGASVALVTAGSLPIMEWLPEDVSVRGAGLAACLLLAAGLNRVLARVVHVALAPSSGRLLDALEQARDGLSRVHRLEDVAAVVLGAARRASGSIDSEPLLYAFDPAREARIDLAGQAHVTARELNAEILARLAQAPGELILRGPLEAEIVRNPPLRPLIHALIEVDALCVLPLRVDGDLEGALIVPRGRRRGALNLEELEALRGFARFIASFLNVLSAHARAQQRVTTSLTELADAAQRIAKLSDDNARLLAAVQVLQTGAAARDGVGHGPAYSPAMRALLARAESERGQSGPLLLVAEAGSDVTAVARLFHDAAASGPFVVGDCTLPAPEACAAALFGAEGQQGWLELARGGSLLLLDVPALPLEVQRVLGDAIALGQLPAHGSQTAQTAQTAQPLDTRVLVSARVPLAELQAQGRIEPRLAQRLAANLVELPPLRQRREDLASLVLLSLDRASRVLARPSIGIEPEAQARLLGYDWPGNLDELRSVIETAVRSARGSRVTLADLPAPLSIAGEALGDDPLDGSLELVERRVLENALHKAGGNKSEAARSLGLKRSTFLDKLRRHGLDGAEGSASTSRPPRPGSTWPD
jgi:DNA-binding NtrC family response regulator